MPVKSTTPTPATLTPEALAAQLGITTQALRTLRDAGSGPAYIVIGPRTIRYLGGDVTTWLRNTIEPEP